MKMLLFSFCALFLFSCSERQRLESRKDAYINSYNSFIENVEKEADSYTKADWEAAETELDEWTGIRRHEIQEGLTNEDEAFVRKLDNRFEYAYAQFLKDQLLNKINSGVQNAKKGIKEGVKKLVE